MLRIDKPCLLVSGAVEYFREHLGVGDYLTEGNRVRMTWFGTGAQKLGLSGGCELLHFENLCRGLHPVTGKKLTVRDKGAHRRVCFFAQISAPKDVSLAYLVAGDKRIGAWWEESVREALVEIEATTATRVRRKGANEDRVTGNMLAAIVTHDASRKLDPQLHTHICIINLTYDETEQRWKGVQPAGIYRHQGFFREVCFQKLKARLTAAGYELTDVRGNGFNLKGVPPELRERFSKRRHEILKRAAELGATSQEALKAITVDTRDDKVHVAPDELRARWQAEAGAELAPLRAVTAGAAGQRFTPGGPSPAEALAAAEAHVFERKSVVNVRDLLREGLVAGRGNVSVMALREEIERRVTSNAMQRGGDDLASSEAVAAETEFVGWAHANRAACARLGTPGDLATLAGEQKAAVTQVLGATARVVILQGDAGTGKTTCLKTIVAGIEQAGGRVFGCAPSAGATDVLRKELTPTADTLQQWLVNESLRERTRGHVVIVDEAGLVSVRQMQALCRLAAVHENRLLLVGDIKQHNSVEAGDALRALQKYAKVPVARLIEIRRQRKFDYRVAVGLLAKGDAYGAFRRFDQLGAVREIRDERDMFRAAAADYVKTIAAGKSCLAISPVWAEIHAFTAEVRAQLKTAGVLSGPERMVPTVAPLQWTQEERRRVHNYHAGDVLVFWRPEGGFHKGELVTVVAREGSELLVQRADGSRTFLAPRRTGGFQVGLMRELGIAIGERLLIRANAKEHGLKNGDIIEVTGFADDSAIRLRDGRTLPADFRQFSHGYATTSHSAQGRTVERGLLFMAEEGIVAADLKQAYVSNSRFRESQMIYTTDRAEALAAMQRPGERTLATEAVEASAGFDTSAHEAVWQRYFAPNRPGLGQAAGGVR